MEEQWIPIDQLPEPGKRHGKYWVIVEGEEFHSGISWLRRKAGLARTDNQGFLSEDVRAIEREDHMDRYSGMVTHFLPIKLPNFPQ